MWQQEHCIRFPLGDEGHGVFGNNCASETPTCSSAQDHRNDDNAEVNTKTDKISGMLISLDSMKRFNIVFVISQ